MAVVYIVEGDASVVCAGGGTPSTRRALDAWYDKVRAAAACPSSVAPVHCIGRYYLICAYSAPVWAVAVHSSECNPGVELELLHGILNHHQQASCLPLLLDEMVEAGTTEPNQLTEMLVTPSYSILGNKTPMVPALPASVESAMPWRTTAASYLSNEIFLDLVECLHMTVSSTGTLLHSHTTGEMRVQCKLSGMPELSLRLTNPPINPSLHRCVRYSTFIDSGVLSFVPPDGNFTLFSYAVTEGSTAVPVNVDPVIDLTTGKIRVRVQARVSVHSATATGSGSKELSGLTLHIQLPRATRGSSCTATKGSVEYLDDSQTMIWTIGSVGLSKPVLLELEGSIDCGPTTERPTLTVGYTIKNHISSSAPRVQQLDISNTSYTKPFKGIKYLTQARAVHFRV